MVELGDSYSGEQRRLLLSFQVPGMPSLGPAGICKLELRWVELESMTEKVATVPVNVNVVPGDAAAGRVPQTNVRNELTFLQVQRAKREAAERLQHGDVAASVRILRAAARDVAAAPSPELREEAAVLRALVDDAESADVRLAARPARADWHRKTRRRGQSLRLRAVHTPPSEACC
jgi:Ca-activated chloride channel homolog